MVKIFAIGVTGWIGGDAVHRIATAHPEYDWTILVRSDAKAAEAATYGLPPSTRFVIGDYDSRNLLATEAAAADIVINWANSDEAAGVSVLLEGLKTKKEPGYFIHLSGAAILAWDDQVSGKYGEESPKVYDDWDGLEEVTSLPDAAMHRPVEKIVLEAGDEVRTAIVSPPWIYGRSRASPVEHSVATTTISMFQAHGKGIRVGQGMARWGTVHIHDLSEVFLRLVEEAVKGGGAATWGRQGYYFVESGDVALALSYLYTAFVDCAPGIYETQGPKGLRTAIPIIGGNFTGPRMNGKILNLGADWGTTDIQTGIFSADTRYQLQTDNGASIFIRTSGPEQPNGDLHLRAVLETGDRKYYWLNNVVDSK
ncbi:putative nucleoside-diphosphate-sugar epimerase protein [Neofusicoccum parvum UCRNP2]|uniref:Putative nucleoside-diphosphate-sugar epimerase protein n=1 Tax=Botryosphaeria parva (strain UCR-NP2) TaxID=1287680 RepID=R1GHD2_BOTPV|nr:putative nucleoside-diphosphate-sugar epimerase protein [Neofusicoccum parvum UCRNP2]